MALNALDRHLALVGFMGAGKTTMAGALADAARSTGRRHRQGDRGAVPRHDPAHLRGARRAAVSAGRGVCGRRGASNGATRRSSTSAAERSRSPTRVTRCDDAFTVLLDVDVDTAWQRVRGSDRPLARDEDEFRRLYDERAAAVPRGRGRGRPERRRRRCDARRRRDPPRGRRARAARRARSRRRPGRARRRLDRDGDPRPARAGGARRPPRLDTRAAARRGGEADRRSSTRLWSELTLDRGGTVVALGGGVGHRHGGLRRGHVPARRAVGRGADDARRSGRRRDRRQDRDRHPAGQEPRRRVPLAGARRRSTRRCSRRCPSASAARGSRSS